MKKSLAVMFGFSLATGLALPGQAQILESAGVYSKAGALGAGLGAAAAAGMNKGSKIPVLTPEQRAQAEQTNKIMLDTAQKEEKAGHQAQAAEFYSKLGQWRIQMFGEKDKASQSAFQKAGDLNMQQKGYVQAESSYRHALTGAVKCFGPGTTELIPYLNKVLSATTAQQNFHEAENVGTQVLTLTEREYGAQDPRTDKARQQLCGVLQQYSDKLKQEERNEELKTVEQRLSALQTQGKPLEASSPAPLPESTASGGTSTGGTATIAQPDAAAGKP